MRHAGWIVAPLLVAVACSGEAADPAASDPVTQLRADVRDYLATIDDEGQVRAVLVHHDGDPVLERYVRSGPQDHWDTKSVTKSVTGTLVGIAEGRGELQLDQTLDELLPEEEMTREVGAIRLREVLTHTAGFRSEDTPRSDDEQYWLTDEWVAQILADRAADGPGDGFAYSDAGAHLVAAVLAEATGEPVLEYARTHLFEPLGIPTEPAYEPLLVPGPGQSAEEVWTPYYEAGFAWPQDPQGIHEGACCLKLRPADLARIGALYLDEGRWGGERVLSASWVRRATSPQVSSTGSGAGDAYGYLWWVTTVDGDPAAVAYGLGGQMIAVVPRRRLVVVLATEYDERDPNRLSTVVGPDTAVGLVETAVAPHVTP